ncbi:MAG: zinc metallopeptidase, partial [Clostridia bacterium]|nr:zinc metallopeptidase [Clostridia bacterium]
MDRYYILLVLPAMIFALWAQFKVKSTFNKYSSVLCSSGMTGRGAAEYILSGQGVTDVSIQKTAGELTDNFNPVT